MINALYIGLKVRTLRKNAHLTQEELATACDVSWRTISNLERGVVMPTVPLIYSLAKYFDITVDELLSIQITKNKSMKRSRAEIQLIEVIYKLDDTFLAHIEEYIELLKKNFS